MLKHLILLLITGMAATICRGQIANDHDLRKHIIRSQKMANDTNRLSEFGYLGVYYYSRANNQNAKDFDSALVYFQKANELSKLLKPASGHFIPEKCLCYLGMSYIALKDNERGTQLYTTAIRSMHAKGLQLEEARAWYKLGLFTINFRAGNADSIAKRFRSGLNDYRNAISIYRRLNKHELEAFIRRDLAIAYIAAGHPDSAKGQYLEMLKIYGNSARPEIGEAYYGLSWLNRSEGNLNISLKYILKGVEHVVKTTDTINAQIVYGELAEVYQELGQTENSIVAYRKTIVEREKIHDYPQIGIFRTIGFIVHGLIKEGKAHEALYEIENAERKHPPESDFIKGIVTGIKAACYDALNRPLLAETTYLEMYKLLSQPNPNAIFFAIGKLDMARFYAKQQKFKKAGFYLTGLTDGGFTVQQRLDLLSLNYKVDSARGDYRSSLNHLLAYKTINDSIFSVTKNKQIAELQISYKIAQKEKDISLLKKDALLQHELVYHANTLRNLTFAGIAFLALCMALLYKNYLAKQNTNHFLNDLVAEKDGLLEDKEWLIKEIHHRVKNNLQIVMSLLQQQSAYVNNEKALEAIQNSKNRMRSIALIHQKLYQSEALNLISMPEYIDEQVNSLIDSFDLDNRIYFEKYVDAIDLDVSQAVPLALIFNEAVTNAIKYAYPQNGVGSIKIYLTKMDKDQAILKIIDQGVGIRDDFNFEKIKSLGMNLMKGLSKQLGGKLKLEHHNGVSVNVAFKIAGPVTPGRGPSK